MIELLNQSLTERADLLHPTAPDLDAVVRAGDRRLRRRRAAALVGVAAALVGVSAGGLLLGQRPGHRTISESPLATALAAGTPTYSIGRVVHVGDLTVTLDHTPRLYVQTELGFVYADRDGTVYATDGHDETALGSIAIHREDRAMVVDGALVAWVTPGPEPALATFDQSSGEVMTTPLEPDQVETEFDQQARVWAIDQRTVYASDARGVLAMTDGRVDVIRPAEAGTGVVVDDVKNGMFAYRVGSESFDHYFLGDTVTDGRRYVFKPTGTPGTLSPDGTHLLLEVDDGVTALVDTESGQELASPHDYAFQLDYAWVDDTHYAAVGIEDPTGGEPAGGWAFDLMICSVTPAQCRTIRSDLELAEGVSVPTGAEIGAG